MEKGYKISPIGFVRKESEKVYLEITLEYSAALKELETFSHIQVLWWCNSCEKEKFRRMTQIDPPFEAPRLGVFAARAPMRPNPIAISTVNIKRCDMKRGIIEVNKIDAYNDTPIIDLKPYMPFYSRIEAPRVPSWASGWPEWMPEEGIGLEDLP